LSGSPNNPAPDLGTDDRVGRDEELLRAVNKSSLRWDKKSQKVQHTRTAFLRLEGKDHNGLSIDRAARVAYQDALHGRPALASLYARDVTAIRVAGASGQLDVVPKPHKPDGANITGLPYPALNPDDDDLAILYAKEFVRISQLVVQPPPDYIKKLQDRADEEEKQ
jgi:hypothetical protein